MSVKPNTENAKPVQDLPVDDLRSRHLRPQDMPRQKLRFPGCEMKTLLFDPKSGLATMLMKMEPGAVLPDHEHVLIEQTYVLEGSLVDKEGPDAGIEVGPGEFIWRPAGSRQPAHGLEPEGRHVHRHVPDPQQVLRAGRPRGGCQRQGLGSGLESLITGLV
jgi:quercetin dioxygenase-like cupin family protein